MDLKSAYLELLKRSLMDVLGPQTYTATRRPAGRVEIVPLPEQERDRRFEGRDWPANGATMIGMKRLDNLQACVEDVLLSAVPGDLIEAGVWRGGATILMRAILRLHDVADREVWVADSFEGLPPGSADEYPADAGDTHHTYRFLAASLDEVKRNFERYGMLDGQVRFLKGWFRDTLPTCNSQSWSVVRLDADMYESTILALQNLYPRLSVGGYLIVDDYGGIEQSKKAVHDYRAQHGIREEIRAIDYTGVFWRKEST
jgi:O-methyltransferase